jgi:hypothetical protein
MNIWWFRNVWNERDCGKEIPQIKEIEPQSSLNGINIAKLVYDIVYWIGIIFKPISIW